MQGGGGVLSAAWQPGVIELCGAGRRGEGCIGFPAMGSAAFVANHGEFKRELRLFLVHWVFLFILADCLAEGL